MITPSSPSLQSRVRLLCVLALAAGAVPEARAQQPAPAEQSCKCSPARAGECFTVHGSVSVYRRAPTVRISIVGTKRVLGLKGGVPEWLEEDLEVPGNVVTGDFLVCPLTRRKAGTIQLVCIESANDMVLTEKH